jgi:hypothetical protein
MPGSLKQESSPLSRIKKGKEAARQIRRVQEVASLPKKYYNKETV